MKFINPLFAAVLQRRYKRFLADVCVPDDVLTVHCPNTGAMTGCAEPNMKVWLSDSGNPKRKYRYTWELAETAAGDMICINTQRANKVAGEALQQNLLPHLSGLQALKAEQKYAEQRRIDWLATDQQGQLVYIEVKSVTLKDPSNANGYFPDTKSVRATEHLKALTIERQNGARAVVLYVVFHSGIKSVQAAAHIDPEYAAAAQHARAAGVEFYGLECAISTAGIDPVGAINVIF